MHRGRWNMGPRFRGDDTSMRGDLRGAMNPEQERKGGEGSLLVLALLACVVGMGAGAIGTLFRLALLRADGWRDAVIAWSHGVPVAGFVLVTAACAAAVALAAWLVRRFSPEASRSGIPHVEAGRARGRAPAPLCPF